MPDAALLARLAAAVDANFEKQTGFLADLVRFPSTRGNEAPLQDWMARQLAARGYGVDRYTLVAFWGVESSYGAVLDNPAVVKPVVRSLATLSALVLPKGTFK